MRLAIVFLLIVNFCGVAITAAVADTPYPRSDVIAELRWAPVAEIKRLAKGSDTWPLTWAADGALYTAFADGYGFTPHKPPKLSMGFAKITANPQSLREGWWGNCTNINSKGVTLGDGKIGLKASGILSLNGRLWMWVRNANRKGEQSELWYSDDFARTWQSVGWRFAEFGYCTFINYGKDYQGARDAFVYIVSHDHPSAYTPADQFVLMRVPTDGLDNRQEYEFFRHRTARGAPVWTSEIMARGSVFNDDKKCFRSGISYNGAIKRYLWWQAKFREDEDGRYSAKFGIFDAPEPWGPWTTVFTTRSWDVNAGETGSFPTKWISADGQTVYLVFSGDDTFAVRKATIRLKGRQGDRNF